MRFPNIYSRVEDLNLLIRLGIDANQVGPLMISCQLFSGKWWRFVLEKDDERLDAKPPRGTNDLH